MKKNFALLGMGSIVACATVAGLGICAGAHTERVVAETATISSLACIGAEIGENASLFTVSAEGTQGIEYTFFSGTVNADGKEKAVSVTVLDGVVEFAFDGAIESGYFSVNADTVYSDGVNELQFDSGYLFDFYAYSVTPVSVLYNPEWLDESELTAVCGVLGYGMVGGVANGVVKVDGKETPVALTVDGYTGEIAFSFQNTPEKFTVYKDCVFVGEGIAFQFDVSYLFDVANGKILPSEAILTVYDGESVFTLNTEVGTSFTLPNHSLGKSCVGFSDGKTLYPVGGTVLVDGPKVFTATYLETVTENAAAIRLDTPYGLRFTTSCDSSSYASIDELDGVALSFGVEFSVFGSAKVLIVPTDPVSLYEKDGKTCYRTAIVNMQAKNYALVYECKPYVKVEYANGETAIVYGKSTADYEGETGRSYAQVLSLAYASLESYDEDTQEEIKALYEDVFATVGVQPVILTYLNGERVNDFNAELAQLLSSSAWKIGDDVDLEDYFATLAPNGYALSDKSVCKGKIGERGLVLTVYYEEDV